MQLGRSASRGWGVNSMSKLGLFGLAENRTDIWATPQDFFDKLNAVFKFDLDVCALPDNAKCERFFSPEDDGLKQEWTGTCWMNPPYGREIIEWVAKAACTAIRRGDESGADTHRGCTSANAGWV